MLWQTDLAEAVGADLGVMDRDAKKIREDGPIIFSQAKTGVGVDQIIEHIISAYHDSTKNRS